MDEPKYKRVLLKISGEALAGEKHFGLDFQVLGQVADVIKECVNMGVQIGVVIGGGNTAMDAARAALRAGAKSSTWCTAGRRSICPPMRRNWRWPLPTAWSSWSW